MSAVDMEMCGWERDDFEPLDGPMTPQQYIPCREGWPTSWRFRVQSDVNKRVARALSMKFTEYEHAVNPPNETSLIDAIVESCVRRGDVTCFLKLARLCKHANQSVAATLWQLVREAFPDGIHTTPVVEAEPWVAPVRVLQATQIERFFTAVHACHLCGAMPSGATTEERVVVDPRSCAAYSINVCGQCATASLVTVKRKSTQMFGVVGEAATTLPLDLRLLDTDRHREQLQLTAKAPVGPTEYTLVYCKHTPASATLREAHLRTALASTCSALAETDGEVRKLAKARLRRLGAHIDAELRRLGLPETDFGELPVEMVWARMFVTPQTSALDVFAGYVGARLRCVRSLRAGCPIEGCPYKGTPATTLEEHVTPRMVMQMRAQAACPELCWMAAEYDNWPHPEVLLDVLRQLKTGGLVGRYTSHSTWSCPGKTAGEVRSATLVHMTVWMPEYQYALPQRMVAPLAVVERAMGMSLETLVRRRGCATAFASDAAAVSDFFKANLTKGRNSNIVRLVLYNEICEQQIGHLAKRPCNHARHHKPFQQRRWRMDWCSVCSKDAVGVP